MEMEAISNLLPSLHYLRALVITEEGFDENGAEEIEVERILHHFALLENIFDEFEELLLVQQIKNELLELVTVKVGNERNEDSISVKSDLLRKGLEPLRKKIYDDISNLITQVSDEDICSKIKVIRAKGSHGGGTYSIFNFDDFPEYEPLDVTVRLLQNRETITDGLTKLFQIDVDELFEHPLWHTMLEIFETLLNSSKIGDTSIAEVEKGILVMARWILLFPPGSDQHVGVVHLTLKYLCNQFDPQQDSKVVTPEKSASILFPLFVSILKLLEMDAFSICLHAKIDEILSIVFLIIAHGEMYVFEGKTSKLMKVLHGISTVEHLWTSSVNFIDSLMKHHHTSSVLGLAIQTGLMNTIVRNLSLLRRNQEHLSRNLFVTLTSLWLSLLYPFSMHSWVKYLCSEAVHPNLGAVLQLGGEMPKIVNMEGSNKLLRHIHTQDHTSIDVWCLVNSSPDDGPIREKVFNLQLFESILHWILKESFNFALNPLNETYFSAFSKNYQFILHQSRPASSLLHSLLLDGKKFLLTELKGNENEKKWKIVECLLSSLSLQQELQTDDDNLMVTVIDLINISLAVIKKPNKSFSTRAVYFKLLQTVTYLLKLNFSFLDLCEELSFLMTNICVFFLEWKQGGEEREENEESEALKSDQVIQISIVETISRALVVPGISFSSTTMVLMTQIIFEILTQLSTCQESEIGNMFSPLLISLCYLHYNEHSLNEIQRILDPSFNHLIPCPLAESSVLMFHIEDNFSSVNQLILDLMKYLSLSCLNSSVVNLWLFRIMKPDDCESSFPSPLPANSKEMNDDPTLSSILHFLNLGCNSPLRQYSCASLNDIEYHLHAITSALMWDVNWCISQSTNLRNQIDPTLWTSETVDLSTGFDPTIEAEIDLRRQLIDPLLLTKSMSSPSLMMPTLKEIPTSVEAILDYCCDLSSTLQWFQSTEAHSTQDLLPLRFHEMTSKELNSSSHSDNTFVKFIFHHFLDGSISISSESLGQYLSIYEEYEATLLSTRAPSSPSVPSSYNLIVAVFSLVSFLLGSHFPSSKIRQLLEHLDQMEVSTISLIRQYQNGKIQDECFRNGILFHSFVRNVLANWFLGWLPNYEILVTTYVWANNGFTDLPYLMAALVLHGIGLVSLENCRGSNISDLTPLLRPHATPRGTFRRVKILFDELKSELLVRNE